MNKTLYKLTSTGAVQTWSIELDGNKYRTHSGQLNGKVVTSKWTTVKGKNTGRSNETSDEEQAILEAQRKYERQIEKGYRYDVNDVGSNIEFKPMLAHKVGDVNELVFPVITQPKLDGIRCILTKNGMMSRNGKPILSAPHIHSQMEATGIWDKYPNAIFDGELYNQQLKANFEKIISLARKSKPTNKDLEESFEFIQYHIYDMLLEPIKDKSKGWFERNRRDEVHLPPVCRWVRTVTVESVDALNDVYLMHLESGYEGQMIRTMNGTYEEKRSKNLLKRKEFVDEEFEILDVLEGQGNRSEMAGRLLMRNITGRGTRDSDQYFCASIRGGEALYVRMLKERNELIGKMATIRYQNLSEYGVPRFPVCVSIRDYE